MASEPEPYPAPSGASLPWPAALKEWTRAVQSWSHGDAAAGAPVCALLRAGLSRLRDAPLDALLAWWPAYGRLLKALATHPLVLLGEAGALIVASAVRAMRRFSPEGAPPELLDQCRRASSWCAQFIRYQSGGSAVPSDQTDALFQALAVGVEDSQRVQLDDAVDVLVAEVRRRSARRRERSGDGPAAAGAAWAGAAPSRVETPHGQDGAGSPAADDFVQRCADLLARALEPHSGGAIAEPPRDVADAAPAGSEAATAAAAGCAVDWSALAPLVAALCFHAPGAVGKDFSTSVADAHAAGTLPVGPCAVAALLRRHPRLRNRQLSLLLGEMRARPWLSGALPPTAAEQASVGLKPPAVRSQRPEELSLGPAQGGSQHPAGASQTCSLAQQSQPQSQYLSQFTTNSNPNPRPPSSSPSSHPRRLAPLLAVCGADPSALGCLLDHLWTLAHAGTFGWAPLALIRLVLHSFAHLLATPQAPFLLSHERAPVLDGAGNAGADGGSGGAASGGGADDGAAATTRAAAVRQVLWPAPLRPWVALLSLAPSRAGLLFLDERRRALLGAAAAAPPAGGGVGVEVQAWRLLGCAPPWWRRAVIEATVDAAADEEGEAGAGVPSGDPTTAQLKQKEVSALLALVAWMLAPGSERAGPSAGQSGEGEAAQEALHEVARVLRRVACAAARAGTAADAEAALSSLCGPDAGDTLAGGDAGAPADATDASSWLPALVLQAAVAAVAVAAEPLGWLRAVWRRLLASSGACEEAPSDPAPDPESRLASAHAAALFTAWLCSLVEYACGEEAGLPLRQRRPSAAVGAAVVAVAVEVAELAAGSRHAADASGAVCALVARVEAARAEAGLRGGSGEEAEAERCLEDSLHAARTRLARLV